MTNLRDWQKKASERREEGAKKYGVHIVNNLHSLGTYKQADFKAGFDSRDHEIDLLLQIIEKQSETIEFYADKKNSNEITEYKGVKITAVGIDGGRRALDTQAEVKQIVERLVKDE